MVVSTFLAAEFHVFYRHNILKQLTEERLSTCSFGLGCERAVD